MAKTFDDKKIIYTMDRVTRSYGTKVVLKDISISYYYGAKIGVVGPNGSGKSSLFKILAGKDTDFAGETSLAPGYTIGYLEQEPELEAGKTVMEIVKEGVKPITDLLADEVKAKGFDSFITTEKRASGTTYYIVLVREDKNGNVADRLRSSGYDCYGVE